jgi:hypothetical protein
MSQPQQKTKQQLIDESIFSRNLNIIFMVSLVFVFGNGELKFRPELAFTQQIASLGILVGLLTLFALFAIFFHRLAERINCNCTSTADNNVIRGNVLPGFIMKVLPLHRIAPLKATEQE